MKKINVFLMLVMLLLSFSAEARKVKLMVSPEDAEIYIDNQFVGTGTFEMNIKSMPVVYRVQKTGYFTHESKVMPYDKRKSISITLREDKYFIGSNRESGKGRFDIQLKPRVTSLPGFLIEVKAEKDCSAQKLEELSQVALKQIEDRKYDTEMLSQGITTIFKFGIAFSGKEVKIAVS